MSRLEGSFVQPGSMTTDVIGLAPAANSVTYSNSSSGHVIPADVLVSAANMEYVQDMHKLNLPLNSYHSKRMYNFSVSNMNSDESPTFDMNSMKKAKTSRQDPMSHRIIEKRRRDRMNSCLADLSQLIPTTILKQGQGRIEKTEIIEMAIRHIKLLQTQLHDSAPEKNKVLLEENKLHGYKDCYNDTSLYMNQIGYNSGDTVFHNLCAYLDQQMVKQKHKIAKIYENVNSQHQVQEPHGQLHGQVSDGCAEAQQGDESTSAPKTTIHSSVHMTDALTYSSNRAHMAEFDAPMENSCSSPDNETSIHLSQDRQQASPENNDMRSEVNFDSGLGSTSNITEKTHSDFSSNHSNEAKAYKYKNKIHERFSGEPEEKKPDITKDFPHFVKNRMTVDDTNSKPSSLTSTDYSSDLHSVRNSSGMNSVEHSSQSSPSDGSVYSRNERQSCNLNNTVPAFALHPMGVHYIPLVLPVSQVMPFMRNHKSMGICHPVSIPVSFTGPFLMGEPDDMDYCTPDNSGGRSSFSQGRKIAWNKNSFHWQ